MKFAIQTASRACFWTTTTLVALASYIATAATAPEMMRSLQRGVDRLLDWIEIIFSIPAQYTIWLDAAGVDAALIYMLFYITSAIFLVLILKLFKFLVFSLGRGMRRLFFGPKKAKAT